MLCPSCTLPSCKFHMLVECAWSTASIENGFEMVPSMNPEKALMLVQDQHLQYRAAVDTRQLSHISRLAAASTRRSALQTVLAECMEYSHTTVRVRSC
jgi:hypothetical protein